MDEEVEGVDAVHRSLDILGIRDVHLDPVHPVGPPRIVVVRATAERGPDVVAGVQQSRDQPAAHVTAGSGDQDLVDREGRGECIHEGALFCRAQECVSRRRVAWWAGLSSRRPPWRRPPLPGCWPPPNIVAPMECGAASPGRHLHGLAPRAGGVVIVPLLARPCWVFTPGLGGSR